MRNLHRYSQLNPCVCSDVTPKHDTNTKSVLFSSLVTDNIFGYLKVVPEIDINMSLVSAKLGTADICSNILL